MKKDKKDKKNEKDTFKIVKTIYQSLPELYIDKA